MKMLQAAPRVPSAEKFCSESLTDVLFEPLKQSRGSLNNEGLILTVLLCHMSGGGKHMV